VHSTLWRSFFGIVQQSLLLTMTPLLCALSALETLEAANAKAVERLSVRKTAPMLGDNMRWSVSVNLDADLRKITVTYDQDIIYDSTEISGFYICQNDEDSCDRAATLEQWEEVPKVNTMLEDSRTISIQLDTIITKDNIDLFWLAYAWRETPVKRYLGLPVYGTEEHYSLPSPPWKTQIMDSRIVDDY